MFKCRFFIFGKVGELHRYVVTCTSSYRKKSWILKIDSLLRHNLNDLNLRYKIIERGARALAASDFRNWYSAATAEKTSVAAIEFKSLIIVLFSAYYLIPLKSFIESGTDQQAIFHFPFLNRQARQVSAASDFLKWCSTATDTQKKF